MIINENTKSPQNSLEKLAFVGKKTANPFVLWVVSHLCTTNVSPLTEMHDQSCTRIPKSPHVRNWADCWTRGA